MMRKKISITFKILISILSILGIVLSFVRAGADGYSHWSKRLLYFTSQSNIWIGALSLAMLVYTLKNRGGADTRVKNTLYMLKYVFTVSITVTCLIFCAVLAPGAANDNYNAWTLPSLITHVIVPTLSIADLFVDGYKITVKRRHIFYTAIPPFLYMIFSTVLYFLKVDFGRGDPFPYFFLNYASPAGVFGFSDEMPYIVGSFYWIILILFVIFGFACLYRKLYNRREK